MPSPPQRGARERELREARDQLRDQHGETDRQQQPWLAAATPCMYTRFIFHTQWCSCMSRLHVRYIIC